MLRRSIFLLLIIFPGIVTAQTDSLAHNDNFNSLNEKYFSARQIYETGYNLYLNGEFSEALTHLSKAVQLKPFYPEAYMTRASVKEAINDKLGALIDYETVARQDEANHEALFKIAHIHHQLGNYDDCISQTANLLDQPGGVTNAVFYKMDPEGGVKEIMTMQSQKSDIYNLRAQCYLGKQEFSDAIKDFDKAIEINGNDADLYVNRGTAYKQWGKSIQAERDFRQALAIDPWHKAAIFNLSLKDDQVSNKIRIDSYTAALQRNDQLAEAYVNRGVLWYSENEYKKALADFDSAHHLMPKDAEVLLNRGLAYEQLGNYHLALEDFKKALNYGADASLVYGYQANALYHLRQFEQAEAYYTLAINLTNESKYFFNRGLARHHLQKYDLACQDLKVAGDRGMKVAVQALRKYCNEDL